METWLHRKDLPKEDSDAVKRLLSLMKKAGNHDMQLLGYTDAVQLKNGTTRNNIDSDIFKKWSSSNFQK
jgi:flagellar motor protein MotB